jgi:hypothetical protein
MPDRMVTVTGTAALICASPESESEPDAAARDKASVLEDWPLKVTNAFSAMQERFAELNLDSIVVAERGMEKLAWASWTRRGTASPSVALLRFASVELKVVVVQPCELDTVQLLPVNPLEQIQEHTPCVTTLVPPLAHVSCD